MKQIEKWIMEINEIKKPGIFKGAGVLSGFIIGAVTGTTVVAITGITGLIGAISGAVALPAGLYLEKKFQREKSERGAKNVKIYFLFILLGALLFFVCLLLANNPNYLWFERN